MNTNTPTNEPFFDYDVVDAAGEKIGIVDNIWVDENTQRPEYIGAKSGSLIAHTYVLPAGSAMVDTANKVVRLPYAEDFIKRAPSLSSGVDMTAEDERKIDAYYGAAASPANHSYAPGAAGMAGAAVGAAGNMAAGAANTAGNMAAGAANTAGNMAAGTASAVRDATYGTPPPPPPNPQYATSSEPVAQASPGPVAYAAGSQPGGVQLRKVVRKERVYVPVDVMREHVEVVGGPQGAAEVQPGPPASNTPISTPPPVPQNVQPNMQPAQPVDAYAADRSQPGDVNAAQPADTGNRRDNNSGTVKPLERPR